MRGRAETNQGVTRRQTEFYPVVHGTHDELKGQGGLRMLPGGSGVGWVKKMKRIENETQQLDDAEVCCQTWKSCERCQVSASQRYMTEKRLFSNKIKSFLENVAG